MARIEYADIGEGLVEIAQQSVKALTYSVGAQLPSVEAPTLVGGTWLYGFDPAIPLDPDKKCHRKQGSLVSNETGDTTSTVASKSSTEKR